MWNPRKSKLRIRLAVFVWGFACGLLWYFSRTLFWTLFCAGAALYITRLILIFRKAIKMYGWPPRVPRRADFNGPNGKNPLRETLPIGPYKLEAAIDTSGLVELSAAEYIALNRLPGEHGNVFKAPPVTFCGFQWDIIIGVVEGQICKIAPLTLSDDIETAFEAYNAVNEFCFRRLGQPSESNKRCVAWDLPNWNVILERPHLVPVVLWQGPSGRYGVNLCLTSDLVLKDVGLKAHAKILIQYWLDRFRNPRVR